MIDQYDNLIHAAMVVSQKALERNDPTEMRRLANDLGRFRGAINKRFASLQGRLNNAAYGREGGDVPPMMKPEPPRGAVATPPPPHMGAMNFERVVIRAGDRITIGTGGGQGGGAGEAPRPATRITVRDV